MGHRKLPRKLLRKLPRKLLRELQRRRLRRLPRRGREEAEGHVGTVPPGP